MYRLAPPAAYARACLHWPAFADATPQSLPFAQDWSNTGPAANPSPKRSGQNHIDLLLPGDDGSGADEVFVFDFDGHTAVSNVFGAATPGNLTLGASAEAQFAGGDSGSPVFVFDSGQWKIIGVANFNGSTTCVPASNVLFGSIGGGSLVVSYADGSRRPGRRRG